MKELTPQDYPVIKELAKKNGIVEDNIKIFFTELGEYEFLVELKKETSGFDQLKFQVELSKKFGCEGEEIGVVTVGGLNKRVQQFRLTSHERTKILDTAEFLKDFLNISGSSQEICNLEGSIKLKL